MIIEITTPEGVKVKVDCTENTLRYFTNNINQIIETSLRKPVEITGDGSGVKLPEIINKLSVSSGTILNPSVTQPARTELEQKIIDYISDRFQVTIKQIKKDLKLFNSEQNLIKTLDEMDRRGWIEKSKVQGEFKLEQFDYEITRLGESLRTKIFQSKPNELEQKIINILSLRGEQPFKEIYECFPFTETKEDIEAALQEMCLKGWLNRRWDEINNYYTLTPLGKLLITKIPSPTKEP